jgi:hypothetical protein
MNRSLSPEHRGFGFTPSAEPSSLLAGKKQRISPIQPFSANIRLDNNCDFSSLQITSLLDRTGNLFATTGKQLRHIRAGTGN